MVFVSKQPKNTRSHCFPSTDLDIPLINQNDRTSTAIENIEMYR